MKRLYATIAMFALFLSCSDETTIYEVSGNTDTIILEDNSVTLDNSIIYDQAGVLDITDQAALSGKYASSGKAQPAGDYPLTLVAQVDTPSFEGGENLTASHVVVAGDFAYVSYNTAEASFVGALDIIDIKNPRNPKVSSRLYFSNADINALTYANGYVYAVGGMDSELSALATSNSFVAKILVSDGKFDLDAGILYGYQAGYNATDVDFYNDKLLVTSGQGGLVKMYSSTDLTLISEAPYSDLRAVASNDTHIALLDASTGVSILDPSLNAVRSIPINSDFGTSSKRTLAFYGEHIVVAEGANGAGIYNANTGTLVGHAPILLDPAQVDDSDIVTNAVATNDNIFLMANGGAGLSLSELQDNGIKRTVGIIQLEGSINYVTSKEDYILAASGREGLQILKLNIPDESLQARCSNLSNYIGDIDLYIEAGTEQRFKGSKRFYDFNVHGSLLLCGSWTVKNAVTIHENALFEMNGNFAVARNSKRGDVIVKSGATLRIEGNLTIYGDLILEDGAKVDFLGSNTAVNIFGQVTRSGNTTVTGTFVDVKNKF